MFLLIVIVVLNNCSWQACKPVSFLIGNNPEGTVTTMIKKDPIT